MEFRTRHPSRPVGIALLILAFSGAAAFGQSMTIQGKLLDAANIPLTGTAVEIRVRIVAPDANRCVLFDETHTENLSGTGGLFALNLNDSLGVRNAPLTYSLENALSNRVPFAIDASFCAGGGSGTVTYAPGATDNRKVIISFRDPSRMASSEAIPEMDLHPAAWAMESRSVGGYPAGSLLRVVGGGTPGSAPVLTPADATELVALAAGTSVKYVGRDLAGGVRVPTYSGNPASPAAGSLWYDSTVGGIKFSDGTNPPRLLGTGNGNGTITEVVAGAGVVGGGTSGAVGVALAPSGVVAGSVGSGSVVPVLQVDTYGRIMTLGSATITGTLPSAGADHQVLMSTGGTWGTAYVGLGDLRKDAGTPLFPGTCPLNQTLNWNSVSGVFECVNLGSIASTQLAGPTGAVAGTYRSVSVNAAGQVLSGTNPTTLGDYFISDGVQNGGSVPRIRSGVADPSGAGADGELYVATGSQKIFRYDLGNAVWETMASAGGAGGTVTGLTAGAGIAVSGSAATPTVALSTTGVAAGTFAKVTTDSYGRVTGGSSQVGDADVSDLAFAKLTGKPATLLGHGITEPLVANAGGAASLQAGVTAGRPSPGVAGQIYIDTDTNTVYYRGASGWQVIGAGTSAGFSGSLAGEVSGGQSATQVNQIGSFIRATILSLLTNVQNATDAKSNGAIVKRDAAGGFAAGAVTADSLVLNGSTSGSATLRVPATVATYDVQLPATAPTAGQVLSATSGSALGWVTPYSGSAINVAAPIINSSGTIGIGTASGSQAGALSPTDWTTFNGKLGTALAAASIWVGNSSNVATAVAPSGDVAVSNTGAFTVNGIKEQSISAPGASAGQVLRYAGANTWTPGFTAMADLRSTVTGASAITGNCTASQTLTWNSGSDNLQCQNISIAAATQLTGVLPVANGGTGTGSTSQGFVFAGPAGANGAPSFRALAASDLSALANQWEESSGNVYRTSGNVGIGTTAPAARLVVANNASVPPPIINSVAQFVGPDGLAARVEMLSAGAASSLYLRRGNGTMASPTALQTGNYIGGMNFSGYGATAFATGPSAQIFSLATENWTDSSQGANLVFTTAANGGTANTERMRVENNGNVGIATAAPASKLHVGAAPIASANYGLLSLGSGAFDGTNSGYFTGNANGTLAAGNAAAGFTGDLLHLQVAGTSRFRVDAAGNVTTGGTLTANASGNSNINATGSGNTVINGGTNTGTLTLGNSTGGITVGGPTSITSTTASTAPSTGALKISGGLGVAGDIFAGATINALTSMMTPQIYGSTAASGSLNLDGTSHGTKGPVLINSTGGNVGIGTTAPIWALQVNSGTNAYGDGVTVNQTASSQLPAFRLFRAKGTVGSETALQLNDALGAVGASGFWTGKPNASFVTGDSRAGMVFLATENWTSASNNGSAISLQTTPNGGAGQTERVRIDHSGNVGIGTSAPGTLLDVVGTNGTIRSLDNGSGGGSFPGVESKNYGANHPIFVLSNARGTAASPGPTQSGDTLGAIIFKGQTTATADIQAARIEAKAENNFAAGVGPTALTFSTAGASGVYAERARIASNGSVGIGSTSPDFKLVVAGGTGAARFTTTDFVAGSAGSNVALFTGASTGNTFGGIQSASAGGTLGAVLALNPNGGNVGIGTTTPNATLQIHSVSSTSVPQLRLNDASGYPRMIFSKAGTDRWTLGGDDSYFNLWDNTAGLNRLTVLPSGNVGVGTTAPASILDLVSTNGSDQINVSATNSSALTLGSIGAGSYAWSVQTGNNASLLNGALRFIQSGSERLRIDAVGNVGINTTSPTERLHVVGNLRVQGSTDCTLGNGAGGTNCSSDIRLKDEVREIEHALAKILSLRGVDFTWNEKSRSPGRRDIGVIAQEVEKVFPTAVVADPSTGYKKVDYAVLVAPLIQAFGELSSRFETTVRGLASTDARVTVLEAENAKLRADAERAKQDNADLKARLDRLENRLAPR